MEIFNISYDKIECQCMFKQVNLKEAISSSNKKDFNCFQFRHLKEDDRTITQIRMVKFENNIPSYTKWQG